MQHSSTQQTESSTPQLSARHLPLSSRTNNYQASPYLLTAPPPASSSSRPVMQQLLPSSLSQVVFPQSTNLNQTSLLGSMGSGGGFELAQALARNGGSQAASSAPMSPALVAALLKVGAGGQHDLQTRLLQLQRQFPNTAAAPTAAATPASLLQTPVPSSSSAMAGFMSSVGNGAMASQPLGGGGVAQALLGPGFLSHLQTPNPSVSLHTATRPESADEGHASGEEDESNGDTFPFKLYRMLHKAEEEGKDDIVSFLPDGKSFAIHKPREFVSDIMVLYFSTTRLSSFQRQLNLYGFRRISEGVRRGAYEHPYFIKGNPTLCKRIKRKRSHTRAPGNGAGSPAMPEIVDPSGGLRALVAAQQILGNSAMTPSNNAVDNEALLSFLLAQRQERESEILRLLGQTQRQGNQQSDDFMRQFTSNFQQQQQPPSNGFGGSWMQGGSI